MSRRSTAILILLVWFGALGWLIQRRSVGIHSGIIVRTWPVPPGASFAGVFRGAEQVGLATLTVDTLPEGLRTDELVTLDLPPQGRATRRSSLRTEALYTKSLRLLRWETNLLTDEGRSTVRGQIGEEGVITIYDGLGTAQETLQVTASGPILLPGAVPFLLANSDNRRVGRIIQATVFDPAAMELVPVRFRVASESTFIVPDSAEYDAATTTWMPVHSDTTPAWRLDGLENGLPVRRWVDAHGVTVRLERSLGLTMAQSAFEIVNNNFRARADSGYLWDTTGTVNITGTIPAASRLGGPEIETLRLLVHDANWIAPSPGMSGGFQRQKGDTVTVTRGTPATPGEAADTLALRSWLGATPLIRSDDAPIEQRARDIVRDETAPVGKARLLGKWVARAVRVENRPGMQSAVRTLARRAGSRDDRLTLLVALLRAESVPARTVAGVRQVGTQFFRDGWVEVYAGSWVPMDPETGAIPADASRLRMVLGRPARPLDLALLAGQMELTVLDSTGTEP